MNDLGQQGFGQPPAGGAGPAGGVEPHRGPLLLGLSLGGLICGILAPVAFFLAKGDLKKIEAGAMDPEGKQMTTIAYWVGLVLTGLIVLAICLNVGLTILAVATS